MAGNSVKLFSIVKISKKIPARQLLALRACVMAKVFFRYLYPGSNGGGTDINKTGIGAVFDFVS